MQAKEATTQPAHQNSNGRLREVYALIWRSNETDDTFDDGEFQQRIPRLMEWLKALHANGHLVACGGGGFENHSGGLTLLNASSAEEAIELGKGSPMNEIGTTEVLVWDVYYADLVEKRTEERLRS